MTTHAQMQCLEYKSQNKGLISFFASEKQKQDKNRIPVRCCQRNEIIKQASLSRKPLAPSGHRQRAEGRPGGVTRSQTCLHIIIPLIRGPLTRDNHFPEPPPPPWPNARCQAASGCQQKSLGVSSNSFPSNKSQRTFRVRKSVKSSQKGN